eukprot:tig00021017_g17184.t1
MPAVAGGDARRRKGAPVGSGGSFAVLGRKIKYEDEDAPANVEASAAAAESDDGKETSAEAAKRARKKQEREALQKELEAAKTELTSMRARRKLEKSMLCVTWLFLRALAAVYLVAFVSLGLQWEGLIGERGLLPARLFMERIRAGHPTGYARVLPSVFWFTGVSDNALELACAAGVALAALAATGYFAVWPVFAALWALYLSFLHAGQDFLGFQWDILLCETGFLALLIAPLWKPLNPARDRAAGRAEPSRIAVFLFRWLLFRLMMASGIVKLNETWTNLTAMNYHYWTQPIPNPVAYYVHHLPEWWHRVEVWITFAVELALPIAVFAGRKTRVACGLLQIAFQVSIAATGNFTFFNHLTAALCLFCLDDAALAPLFPRACAPVLPPRPPSKPRRRAARLLRLAVVGPAAALVLAASLVPFAATFFPTQALPPACAWAYHKTESFRLVGRYGLFARMTTDRREVVLEGSADGVAWRPYEFRFKPGNLTRRPPFVAPLQPRLDWQMWFAALSEYPQNPWLISLVRRIFEGSPPVLALLESDPFAGAPPAFLRARAYRYTYAAPGSEAARAGAWWARTDLPDYMPTLERGNPSVEQFLKHHGLWDGPKPAGNGDARRTLPDALRRLRW